MFTYCRRVVKCGGQSRMPNVFLYGSVPCCLEQGRPLNWKLALSARLVSQQALGNLPVFSQFWGYRGMQPGLTDMVLGFELRSFCGTASPLPAETPQSCCCMFWHVTKICSITFHDMWELFFLIFFLNKYLSLTLDFRRSTCSPSWVCFAFMNLLPISLSLATFPHRFQCSSFIIIFCLWVMTSLTFYLSCWCKDRLTLLHFLVSRALRPWQTFWTVKTIFCI